MLFQKHDVCAIFIDRISKCLLLLLGQYVCWWTISPREYHAPSSQCFYHWVNASVGGLVVPEDIMRPVVSASITGSIPLLVDY